MINVKKWIGSRKTDHDLMLLLMIGGFYSLSIALSNTFVNVYLWKQSGELIDLGLYNLFIVIFQPLAFIIAGKVSKKIDRVVVLRLGVSFLAAFFLTVLVLKDQAVNYMYLLGAIIGIGYGFYWLAFNVLTFEITEPETRDFFNGFLGILTSLSGMIGPMLAGLIISRLTNTIGYKVIFAVSLMLFTVAVMLSFFFTSRKAHGDYILLKIIQERKRNKNWRLITNAHVFQGLREGTFTFFINVFVYIVTKSEMALGTFSFLNSFVAFFTYIVASRWITKKMRKKAILAGGLMLYFSLFLILFQISYERLLIYTIAIGIAYPILLVPYSSITYDVIGKGWNIAQARIEYIVVREIFLNAGRILSILFFIFTVALTNETKTIPFLLLLIGSGHAFIYLFVKQIRLKESNRPLKQEKRIHRPNLADGEKG
ncbi:MULTISPECIES: MFS transporter [Aeribacillus]|uniref:MFS transporter n=1 Tax=Aeribacillus TaxID=1055323 RepID=UPI001199F2B8|nr:MFS transporter [Aeribacillus composti]MED0702179.1 MFS transporter [Aeribacillus composti]TVZ88344.1 YQGE family putative transporter [Aeribacillus composti]